MIIELILFVAGIFLLVKGADFLVDGSASLAKRIGVSTLVIGLTVVAFGTSMPELIINVLAALKGSSEISLGNILGSNIANILLVLGVVAIIKPIQIKSSTIWKQIPLALLSVVVLLIFINSSILHGGTSNFSLDRSEGIILIIFFIIFMYYSFGESKRTKNHRSLDSIGVEDQSKKTAILLILIGLVSLYFGGKWVVNGAVLFAQFMGLSEFLISATVIAVGTSLPELATGVIAARKNQIDMSVGNSIGSNIFNVFWVLGVTAIISPLVVEKFINFDILFSIGATVLLFGAVIFGKRRKTVGRFEGIIFLFAYFTYIVAIVFRG